MVVRGPILHPRLIFNLGIINFEDTVPYIDCWFSTSTRRVLFLDYHPNDIWIGSSHTDWLILWNTCIYARTSLLHAEQSDCYKLGPLFEDNIVQKAIPVNKALCKFLCDGGVEEHGQKR